MSSLYRNSIDEVRTLIESRHGQNYIIFNLSDRKYDYSKFDHRVLDFKWLDHHAPALETLLNIVLMIQSFLSQNIHHVVIIHCNAGKGRTGTAICALMLFIGYFNNVDDCLRFYGHQRFTCGKGVSQPCQLEQC